MSLNIVLFASVIYYGAASLGDLIDWLTSNWAWTEWITWILWPLAAVASLVVVFFTFSIVANLIAAPFNGFLAAAVARELGKSQQNGESRPLHREIWLAFRSESHKLLYFAVRALPLLLLFFIPGVQVAAPIIWFVFGAWMLSLEYMEYPMGNQGMMFADVRAKVAQKRSLSLGFGASVMFLTLIPGLNFLVMPAAVAAATKLYFDLYNGDSNSNNQAVVAK